MKKVISLLFLVLLLISLSALVLLAGQKLRIEESIKLLKEGNLRYTKNERMYAYQYVSLQEEANDKTQPFALILHCTDLSIPIEILFDRKIGDLYNISSPANIIDRIQLNAIEYAIDKFDIPYILILANSQCSLIQELIDTTQSKEFLAFLSDKIRPALDKTLKVINEKEPEKIVNGTIKANLYQSVESLIKQSSIIRERLKKGVMKIEVAVYNPTTNLIEWLGNHPNEKLLFEAEYNDKTNENKNDKISYSDIFINKNIFFMLSFIILCSLISASIIFIVIYIKAKK